jgi:hypothetical protein
MSERPKQGIQLGAFTGQRIDCAENFEQGILHPFYGDFILCSPCEQVHRAD